ncbi:MAG: AfsR/SARP family transcriptional regulator, partial [Ilumatobacteraceae bacterium]
MTAVECRVLGHPQLLVEGMVLPLSGRQLALACRLALTAHVPMPSHRLRTTWQHDEATDGALRVALSRLRSAVAPVSIARIDHGYVLAPTAHVDAERFEQLLRSARTSPDSAERRITLVEEALGLWRGPAFDGLHMLPWFDLEAARLNELHEQAIDLRFDLALSVDAGRERIGDLIGDLTVAVGSHPEREHRAAALALALYRSGRHVESLAVMRDTRMRLRELGLTPGPRLDELEGQVLRHDPALANASVPADRTGIDEVTRSLRAVESLLREGASDIAETMAERAVEAARRVGDPATIARALVAQAHAASVNGVTPVDGLLAEAQSLAREVNDGHTLARSALVRFGAGIPIDWNAALIELCEPLDLLPADAPERVDLLSAAAAVVAFSDAGPQADRVVQAAGATHRAVSTPRTEAVLSAITTIVDAVAARPDRGAYERAQRSLELARVSGDLSLVVVALHAVLRTGFSDGHLDAIESLLPELDEASRRAGLAFGLARVPLCRASIALARGEFESVPDHIAEARS